MANEISSDPYLTRVVPSVHVSGAENGIVQLCVRVLVNLLAQALPDDWQGHLLQHQVPGHFQVTPSRDIAHFSIPEGQVFRWEANRPDKRIIGRERGVQLDEGDVTPAILRIRAIGVAVEHGMEEDVLRVSDHFDAVISDQDVVLAKVQRPVIRMSEHVHGEDKAVSCGQNPLPVDNDASTNMRFRWLELIHGQGNLPWP